MPQAKISPAIRSAEQQIRTNEGHVRESRRRPTDALDDLSSVESRQRNARRVRVMESLHIAAGQVTAVQYHEPYATVLAGSSNDGLVGVTGRYSNRQIAQLAAQLFDVALGQL